MLPGDVAVEEQPGSEKRKREDPEEDEPNTGEPVIGVVGTSVPPSRMTARKLEDIREAVAAARATPVEPTTPSMPTAAAPANMQERQTTNRSASRRKVKSHRNSHQVPQRKKHQRPRQA